MLRNKLVPGNPASVKEEWNKYKADKIKSVNAILRKNRNKIDIFCQNCEKYVSHSKFLAHTTSRGCTNMDPLLKLNKFKLQFKK